MITGRANGHNRVKMMNQENNTGNKPVVSKLNEWPAFTMAPKFSSSQEDMVIVSILPHCISLEQNGQTIILHNGVWEHLADTVKGYYDDAIDVCKHIDEGIHAMNLKDPRYQEIVRKNNKK